MAPRLSPDIEYLCELPCNECGDTVECEVTGFKGDASHQACCPDGHTFNISAPRPDGDTLAEWQRDDALARALAEES